MAKKQDARLMNQTWPVWCAIVCFRCEGMVAGQFNYKVMNRPTLRSKALLAGWKLIANEWVCKPCIKDIGVKEIQCTP